MCLKLIMRTPNIPEQSISKRDIFKQYLLAHKSLTTVRGYLSSLTTTSLVGNITQSLYNTSDIFEITDVSKIEKIYYYTLKDEINGLSHSRFSAALRLYLEFIKKQNEKRDS